MGNLIYFEGIKKFMKEDIILTLGHKFNFFIRA